MFNHDEFYFDTIRKYVAYFGAVFNDIYITRTLPDGSVSAKIKVPIAYEKREKALIRLSADPDLNKPEAISLPSMSFELETFHYDSPRKIPTMSRVVRNISGNPNAMKMQYVPVPYDLTWKLYIGVKNVQDGTKIVEQIIPYFTPDIVATLELIPEMNISQDIPLILTDVSQTDVYTKDYKERTSILWTLTFTMKAWFYGPVKENPLIKFAKTYFHATHEDQEYSNNNPAILITDTPGMLANGSPTTNAAASVDPLTIYVDDDWGYAETRESLLVR